MAASGSGSTATMPPQPTIVKLAILSRLSVIALGICANLLFPDHLSTDAFVSPANITERNGNHPADRLVESLLGGFRRWDAEQFLHIAEHGYVYDMSLAFYPLYPQVIRFVTQFLLRAVHLQMWFTFRTLSLVVAMVLNVAFFVRAATMLHRLTGELFRRPTISNLVVLLFCCNPASIFFTAPYTESLFTWLGYTVMYNCVIGGNILSVVVPLALCILCRSNGLVNVGFVIFYGSQAVRTEISAERYAQAIAAVLRIVFVASVAGLVFSAIQWYQFDLFCTSYESTVPSYLMNYANANGYAVAGSFPAPEWCNSQDPIPYSYIQKRYWNVGFLNYYELKQLPNFLLATPILYLFTKELCTYLWKHWTLVINLKFLSLSTDGDHRLFVYMVHGGFMTIVCWLFVHIQVSTRLLASSSPCLYWFSAKYLMKHGSGYRNGTDFVQSIRRGNLIALWYFVYFVAGVIMFCNGLPWT